MLKILTQRKKNERVNPIAIIHPDKFAEKRET